MIRYFEQIYKANGCDMSNFIADVPYKVTDDHNHAMCVPFIEKEVKKALFSMHLDKAPNIDGLNPTFLPTILGCC